MTPGCSSKVRFTRSSNSRIRVICVRIQISRSLSEPFSGTRTPFGLGGELRDAGLIRSLEDLLDRAVSQVLGEHLDPPRAVVADLAAGLDVLPDRELPFAGEP